LAKNPSEAAAEHGEPVSDSVKFGGSYDAVRPFSGTIAGLKQRSEGKSIEKGLLAMAGRSAAESRKALLT
jgi:hypothetical protein